MSDTSFEWYTEEFCDFSNQEANDVLYNKMLESLKENKGLMVCKFGTIELSNVLALYYSKHLSLKIIFDFLRIKINIIPSHSFKYLCNNAGFFPNDCKKYGNKYCDLVLNDSKKIDILGSYYKREKYINKFLNNPIKINIDGYISPFFWKNPWTKILEGKKVLIISPFVDSIKKQYEKRKVLFEDINVLPEFGEIHFIKAVQSIAGNKVPYDNWFDALDSMKSQMDMIDFDIVLIGCGSYGLHLAAHAKDMNKIGVHMGGNLQLLFGIYGHRWENDEEYKKYINTNWIKPSIDETPKNNREIEEGCYW